MKNNIKITIITSTLNCNDDLWITCYSIRNQTYKNIQWIVADGGSENETLNTIYSNSDIITNFISGPDGGIYEAWNKACEIIQGSWVIFLGAGDEFCSPDTLKDVVNELTHLKEDIVIAYGNVYQFLGHEIIYEYRRVDFDQWDDYRPKLPAHQGVFHRAKIFEKTNVFDESYKIIADSKLLLIILKTGNAEYLNIDVTKMMPNGVSCQNESASRIMREFFRLEAELSYSIPFFKKKRYIFTVYLKMLLLKFSGSKLILLIKYIKRKYNFLIRSNRIF